MTAQELRNIYKSKKYQIAEINLIGIRNNKDQEKDVFNDNFLIWDSELDEVLELECTTDPGVFYTKNPLNRKGCAHLMPGFYKGAYQVGKHRGYTALVQTGAKVRVWRDKNKNFLQDDNIEEYGYFGINIHKQSFLRDKILKASAGCQVIKDPKDFDILMTIILNSDTYKKNKRAKFNYLLIEV